MLIYKKIFLENKKIFTNAPVVLAYMMCLEVNVGGKLSCVKPEIEKNDLKCLYGFTFPRSSQLSFQANKRENR